MIDVSYVIASLLVGGCVWQLVRCTHTRRYKSTTLGHTGLVPVRDKAQPLKDGEKFDIIVVGAGCAGCVIANALANSGFSVLLVDRTWDTEDQEWSRSHAIVGEYFQPGGIEALKSLNLKQCLTSNRNIVPSFGYYIYKPKSDAHPAKHITFKYPTKKPHTTMERFGFVPLQTPDTPRDARVAPSPSATATRPDADLTDGLTACCFYYDKFIDDLRDAAHKHQRITTHKLNVKEFVCENDTVIGVEGNDGEKYYSSLTLLCDGNLAVNLRKTFNPTQKPKILSTWVGLLMKHNDWDTPLPNPYHGHVFLTNPSPVLCYQVAPSDTRVLVCIDGEITDYYTYMKDTVYPQMPPRLQPAFLEAVESRDYSIKNAYTHLSPKKLHKKGLLALGDALNMRHAVTGGGMTVIMQDAACLSKLINECDDINNPHVTQYIMDQFNRERQKYASTINTLANALHSVFCTPTGQIERTFLQNACFQYLGSGGCKTAGPIGLLSGLVDSPIVLVIHFFSVVFHAMLSLKDISRVYVILNEGVRILMPFAFREKVVLLSTWPFRKLVNLVFPWEDVLKEYE